MYRGAVKAQNKSTPQQQQQPEKRQAPQQQQQVDDWLRKIVLSNQSQVQYPVATPSPVKQRAAAFVPQTDSVYSQEEFSNEAAYDTELEIETELHQYSTTTSDRKQVSPTTDIPPGETTLNSAADDSTSPLAARFTEWQKAVIMSELLGVPKGFN